MPRPRLVVPLAAARLAVLLAVLLATAVAPRAAAQAGAAPSATVPEHVRARLRVPDSATIQAIALRDGTTLVGRIVAVGADSIRFRSRGAEATIATAAIARVQEAPASALRPNGEYWFPNPNATRLLFAPTGRMLPRGSGYFSDYFIVLPGGAYGVGDRFTLGGGVSLVPGAPSQAFFVTPKVGLVQRPKVNVAAGALLLAVPDLDGGGDAFTAGIGYGVATYGTPDASVTVGLGYGFQGDDVADDPVAMVGAELRVSRRVGLVTENYVIPGMHEGALVSYAVRFMGEQLALDLGFVNVTRHAVLPGAPFVGFVFNVR